MSVQDITTLVATHNIVAETDEHYQRVEWLASGLLPYIRTQLDSRGFEISRKNADLVEFFAQIAVELLLLQHKHSAGVPAETPAPAGLQAAA